MFLEFLLKQIVQETGFATKLVDILFVDVTKILEVGQVGTVCKKETIIKRYNIIVIIFKIFGSIVWRRYMNESETNLYVMTQNAVSNYLSWVGCY